MKKCEMKHQRKGRTSTLIFLHEEIRAHALCGLDKREIGWDSPFEIRFQMGAVPSWLGFGVYKNPLVKGLGLLILIETPKPY